MPVAFTQEDFLVRTEIQLCERTNTCTSKSFIFSIYDNYYMFRKELLSYTNYSVLK